MAGSLLSKLEDEDRTLIERLQEATPRPIVLGRLGRKDAATGLIGLAGGDDSDVASEAARLLAMLRDPDRRSDLEALQSSSTSFTAAWACVGAVLVDGQCDSELITTHLSDDTRLGRWCAIALGRLKDNRGLDGLLAILRMDDPKMRAEAALALGELGDRRAVSALISLLDVKQVRWAAIEALGLIGDKRALEPLTRLMKDEPDATNLPRYERALKSVVP